MIPPHVKKYSLERVGKTYRGYAIFHSDRKVFRAEVEVYNNTWIIRGVPFFSKNFVRVYEMIYDQWERNRYVMFYPWDGKFGGRKLLAEYNIGIKKIDKIISYYSTREKYAGGIVNGYLVLSNGENVEVYDDKRYLLARLKPEDVETFLYTPNADVVKILKKKITPSSGLLDLLLLSRHPNQS